MSDKFPAELNRPTLIRRAANATVTLTIAGLLIGLTVVSIGALHLRANNDPAMAAYPPVTVTTVEVKSQASFRIASRYVGRLEAARETSLAFERAGLVTDVLFEEGEKIEKGDVIARLDTALLATSLKELEAQKDEIDARRELAKATLARQSNLNRKGWSPEQRYDEARFGVAELTAALERLDANISAVRINLEKSQVHAPFSGTVGHRAIDEGTVIAAGANILTLIESAKRRVRVGLPPDVSARLKDSETYTFDISGQSYQGRLFNVRPDLETGTRTVTAIFAIDRADAAPLGEIAMLNIPRTVEQPGVWLPLAALSEGQKGLWSVFVIDGTDAAPTVSRIAVDVLHSAKTRVFVAGNIPNGAAIVVTGTNRIIPGQRVAANLTE